jgi:hypothetical protein
MSLEELLAAATPGPWEPIIEAGDEWWFGQGSQARIRGAKQHEWSSLAVLGCDDEEEKADARLIALAPDLARLALDMGDALRADEMSFETADALLARLDGIANKDEAA